jgi:leucyl aminopeptidase
MIVSSARSHALDSDADTVAIGVFHGEPLERDLAGGALEALLERGEARANFKHLALAHDGERRVLLVGLGSRARLDGERARIAAGVVYGRGLELGTERLCWQLPPGADDEIAAAIVEGTLLRAYRFDRYRGDQRERGPLAALVISSSDRDLGRAVATATTLANAQNRVRDLANRPPNDLTPTALAQYALDIAKVQPEVEVTVLDEAEIRERGMGAFAAVAAGSEQPAKLIQLSYRASEQPPLALVGKAVTFDSGGLWLKPPAKMHEMKFDMAGGAAVIEAVAALAELRAPVHVIGIVGATENMIGGGAMRPGDVVTAYDGTTIEINNTDAEGRLVLADCVTHARRLGAAEIVDVATLTSAVATALGSVHAGLFSNDDALAAQVAASGERTGERVWRLPLDPRYAEMVRGRVGELVNLTERREAQAITAAELIHHFAGDVPWAHIDIAGVANDVRSGYVADRGATGFGLRLLVDLAASLAVSS